MENRPRIKIPLSTTDKLIEFSGWALLSILWGSTFLYWMALPESIPIHFDVAGKPDAWASKYFLILIPLTSTILYAGLTILNRYPHIFNYPVPISNNNAQKQYTSVTRFLRYLKLVIVFIFGYIQLQTTKVALGSDSGLGSWFLPAMLATIFIPLVLYIIKAYKIKP